MQVPSDNQFNAERHYIRLSLPKAECTLLCLYFLKSSFDIIMLFNDPFFSVLTRYLG